MYVFISSAHYFQWLLDKFTNISIYMQLKVDSRYYEVSV